MTLLFGFAAVNTGNNLLFLIVAALLGFMAVTGLFGWANIRELEVECSLPDEVYCDLQTLVTVRVRNTKSYLPSFLLRLRIFDETVTVPLVRARATETVSFTHAFRRRGLRPFGPCTVSSPFPVNFFVRGRRGELDQTAVVFPSPRPAEALSAAAPERESGQTRTLRRGYEGEVEKIGDYSGAEPLKMIHWRLSARHEQFKVKEMSGTGALPVVIDVEQLPGANVEQRLSTAAYLVNALMRNNRPVGLKRGIDVIAPALSRPHRLRLLKELALYGQD
jgi:uncharacterized protein (DUF58 family)